MSGLLLYLLCVRNKVTEGGEGKMPRDKKDKKWDPDKPEIIENELPLQEIVPDKKKEEQEEAEKAELRRRILEDPEAAEKYKKKKKDEPEKINKIRNCN